MTKHNSSETNQQPESSANARSRPRDRRRPQQFELSLLPPPGRRANQAAKAQRHQISLTTASCQNRDSHSLAAMWSFRDPPRSSNPPSQCLTSFASPQAAITSPSTLWSGNMFLILHVSIFTRGIVAGMGGQRLSMRNFLFGVPGR